MDKSTRCRVGIKENVTSLSVLEVNSQPSKRTHEARRVRFYRIMYRNASLFRTLPLWSQGQRASTTQGSSCRRGGERRRWNIAAFSVCVAYKSEVTYITMKTATQTRPWYQPALRGRRADLNNQDEYALVFLVRKCHMPRSSSHPDAVSTPSVLSFLSRRWLSLRRYPILLSLAYH